MGVANEIVSQGTPRGDRVPPRIDAHHHLWEYCAEEFGWISEEMAGLRRDFLTEDLRSEAQSAGIDGTVVVQARESLEETRWLLECARAEPLLCGVVGWAPLEDSKLPEILGEFESAEKLIGFREIVQGKPDGYLDRPEFNRGVQTLTELEFSYDILIREHQLVEAARFVDRHPNQRFVLDHAAKPKIALQEVEPWKRHCIELAQRPNVSCKLSGLVTEADWQHWTKESIRPYLDVCVEAFGTQRLLAGSDWPVCGLACGYSQWWKLLEEYFAGFSEDERGRIFGDNARRIYRLAEGVEGSS
jgi:L-fuconolactonase